MHESSRNSVHGQRPRMAQVLTPRGVKNFSPAGCFPFSTVAQTVRGRPEIEAVGWKPGIAQGKPGFGSPSASFRTWEPFPNAIHRVWGPRPRSPEDYIQPQRTLRAAEEGEPRRHPHPANPAVPLPYDLLASPPTILPSHFSAPPAMMRTRAVQGRRQYARVERKSSIPTTSRPLPTFSGGGSWAVPLFEDGP